MSGRKLCRYCARPLPPGKTAYCNKFHARVHVLTTRRGRGILRNEVWKRDAGVCANCGLDTKATQRILETAQENFVGTAAWDELERAGFTRNIALWQADHITPVIEGGDVDDATGCQTLCVPCHKADNAALARRRFEAETGQKGLFNSDEVVEASSGGRFEIAKVSFSAGKPIFGKGSHGTGG